MLKRKGGKMQRDPRVRAIRYHLWHSKAMRPLRFSRMRGLRHWTIARAYALFKHRRRQALERDLERQYTAMRAAVEALRLMDERGVVARTEAERAAQQGAGVGRLYRIAMGKQGVWDQVPIEYARVQTEFPAKEPFNEGWRRPRKE
ncbi:hypothetical protein BDY21DRAFT_374856 [Lineolata rhizophorae]|uniref:Uncharacterized protein n=1 Tax=Lineolata rhizophorae TaxID=578093 RepID=A0A6A6NPG7_9PEZI|nr:hypothetical protein BDY21DRAFT_374856 [Lineolata rhizophorae]